MAPNENHVVELPAIGMHAMELRIYCIMGCSKHDFILSKIRTCELTEYLIGL